MKRSKKPQSVFAVRSLRVSGWMIFFLCCLPLLLTGCPATQSLPWATKEELKIALSDIELQEIMALETIFLLKLRVINPNDTAMEIRSLKCELKINGEPFASGISGERKGVPPFGTISIPVVVYTSKFDLVGTVIEIIQKDVLMQNDGEAEGSLNYELDGQLHLGQEGQEVFPFHLAGKIVQSRSKK